MYPPETTIPKDSNEILAYLTSEAWRWSVQELREETNWSIKICLTPENMLEMAPASTVCTWCVLKGGVRRILGPDRVHDTLPHVAVAPSAGVQVSIEADFVPMVELVQRLLKLLRQATIALLGTD